MLLLLLALTDRVYDQALIRRPIGRAVTRSVAGELLQLLASKIVCINVQPMTSIARKQDALTATRKRHDPRASWLVAAASRGHQAAWCRSDCLPFCSRTIKSACP